MHVINCDIQMSLNTCSFDDNVSLQKPNNVALNQLKQITVSATNLSAEADYCVSNQPIS